MFRTRFFLSVMILLIILSGCSPSGGSIFDASLPLGSLWKTTALADGSLDWNSASAVASEQHAGYLLARQLMINTKFTDKEYSEGTQQDDLQVTIRRMAETDHVIAVIGANSNPASMRATSLVNFFNMPMIVPSATGNNILPSSNVWAFRLSPSGSAFAAYVFGTAVKASAFTIVTPTPAATKEESKTADTQADDSSLKLAILFEENTFGESAAVAAAHAAINEKVSIIKYASFPAENPDQVVVNGLIDSINQARPDMVYLISNDPAVALQLITVFHARIKKDNMPVILGQGSGFTSQVFTNSTDSEGTYIVRQKLDLNNCPNGVDSIQKAQNYAAIYILNQAVQQASQSFQKPWWKFWPSEDPRLEQITIFREKLRDSLKATNMDVPCLGKVAFDNSGENKQLQFELIMVHGGKTTNVVIEDFQKKLNDLLTR
ncbi:MAG: hypothetical protein LWX83_12320 [Anaerolineae bacterium]|nr:hypothetical protein [Anaerolineae bacterium]